MGLTCRGCGGSKLSISTAQGSTTWWRCAACGHYTGTHPGDPWPETMPIQAAQLPAPRTEPLPAVPQPCAVCGAEETTYRVSTDVTGREVSVAFCSVECLATKFGLVRAVRARADDSPLVASSEGAP